MTHQSSEPAHAETLKDEYAGIDAARCIFTSRFWKWEPKDVIIFHFMKVKEMPTALCQSLKEYYFHF